jgi:hypothetical protein
MSSAAPECGANWRKSVDQISDRAMRYRAQAPECRPPGPPICAFCGSTSNVEVHHVDGFEDHLEPENVIWSCRRCNVRIGIVMARAGIGRRTRQANPQDQGAKSLGQWLTAVLSMKGESDRMDPSVAVEMIRATPPERRSEFAREIWEIRRKRGTDHS